MEPNGTEQKRTEPNGTEHIRTNNGTEPDETERNGMGIFVVGERRNTLQPTTKLTSRWWLMLFLFHNIPLRPSFDR